MATFWILLFIATVSGSCWAGIPYKDVELNIFADQKWSFEKMALEDNGPIKDNKTLGKIETALLSSSPAVPYALINQLSGDVWKASFAKIIPNDGEVNRMRELTSAIHNELEKIQHSLKDISTTNFETVAKKIRTDFFKLLEIFANPVSIFKKYPLIGSPPLIALAKFVASFNQKMVNTATIACAVRNVLLDYRPRAVDARLDRLQPDNYFMPQIRSSVMALTYDENGYHKSETLQCGGVCVDKSKSMMCLKDDFSTNEFDINYDCAEGYAGLVRQRVEKMFPVHLFDSSCGQKDSIKSTDGYLTMRLKHFVTDKEANGNDHKLNGDRFFRLYINDNLTDVVRIKDLDRNEMFEWELKNKDAKVKVEISRLRKGDDVIFSTKGTVNDFLTNGLRNGALETISFWQSVSEYQMTLPPVETSSAESLPIKETEKMPFIENTFRHFHPPRLG